MIYLNTGIKISLRKFIRAAYRNSLTMYRDDLYNNRSEMRPGIVIDYAEPAIEKIKVKVPLVVDLGKSEDGPRLMWGYIPHEMRDMLMQKFNKSHGKFKVNDGKQSFIVRAINMREYECEAIEIDRRRHSEKKPPRLLFSTKSKK